MRKIVLLLMGVFIGSSVASAAVYELGEGEYGYSLQLENNDTLTVNGGGASGIEAYGFASIEVHYTSLPLGLDVGGIYTLGLRDNSNLQYNGGGTGGMRFYGDARAVLRGGSILHLSSYQRPLGGDYPPSYWDKHITIEYSGELPTVDENNLLTGLWPDGSAFSIQLHDGTGVFHPAISNIEFVPEPATVLLFGLGGLILRKRKL